MGDVNFNRLFGVDSLGIIQRQASHPMLTNPLIAAAMAKNAELAMQLTDLVMESSEGPLKIRRDVSFTAGGISVRFETDGHENQTMLVTFDLGAGLQLDCFHCLIAENDDVWFQFAYRGPDYAKNVRHTQMAQGEPLAEQVALPGFLSAFCDLRLEEHFEDREQKDAWYAAWYLS